MVALEKVLAEMKSESLNGANTGESNNYCLIGTGSNYCLFGNAQPDSDTLPESTSQADAQSLNLTAVNFCLF